MIDDAFKSESYYFYENIDTIKHDGSILLANVTIGFFNVDKNEIFIEISPKVDNRLELTIQLIDGSPRPEAILLLDDNLTVLHCNSAFYDIFGAVKDSCLSDFNNKLGNTFLADEKNGLLDRIHSSLKIDNYFYTEVQINTCSGFTRWVALDLQRCVIDSSGEKLRCFMYCIEKQVQSQLERDIVNQYFNAMQSLSDDILFHINLKNKTFRHSDINAMSFGISPEIPDFVNNFIENGVVHPDDGDAYRNFTDKIFAGENVDFEVRCAVGIDVFEWFNIKSTFIYDSDGLPIEVFGRSQNIQGRKDLEYLASRDPMTEVFNKVTFEHKVSSVLRESSNYETHALVFIDLDDFKSVNDTLGHAFGDCLLTTVAKRLKRVVRDTDIVGRFGGDEFAVFFQSVGNKDLAFSRTNLLLDTLSKEFNFNNISYFTKASLGISVFPDHGLTYDDLLDKADKALYISKDKGKNIVTIFDEKN